MVEYPAMKALIAIISEDGELILKQIPRPDPTGVMPDALGERLITRQGSDLIQDITTRAVHLSSTIADHVQIIVVAAVISLVVAAEVAEA